MGTILCVYEFGAGLGHLNRLLAVAKSLADHRIIFAVPDLRLGTSLVHAKLGSAIEIRAGSSWPAPTDPKSRTVPTHTFADVIRLFNFDKPELLQRNVRHWEKTIQELKPDLIIADFAPALRMASAKRIPTIVVGNGYSAPPAGMLLPPMRPWEDVVPPKSRANEGRVLTTVNEVQVAHNGSAVDFFADLFQGDQTFVCTLAEFDPYRRFRTGPLSWPFNIPVMNSGPAFDERSGPDVFVYLPSNHPFLPGVLEAMSHLGRRVQVYVQGADPQAVARRCGATVGVHTKPAPFDQLLPQTRLILHHAGLGTAYAGLAAGVPQLVIPLNLEHLITCVGLEAFGVAQKLSVKPQPTRHQLVEICTQALDNQDRKQAALLSASTLAARRVENPTGDIVNASQRYL